MTTCRIVALLGVPPHEVRALPSDDYELLERYFAEEPWGPWRDNMHAAIIATEIRRMRNPKTTAKSSDFLLVHPERRRRGNLKALVDALRAMAGGQRKHVSEVKPRKRSSRRRRKT